MKLKMKFLLLSFLLLFSRGCDFYSTSLWYFDNPSHEVNPLSSILGFGWNGLVISNLIIVALILVAFYFYTFKYSIPVPKTEIKNLNDFVSETYFNEKGKFYKVFYRLPKNKKVAIAHNGYILVRAGIVGSFLATFHNLCLFYDVPFYEEYNQFVKYPEYVVYALIVCTIVFFIYRLWKNEHEVANRKYHIEKQNIAL